MVISRNSQLGLMLFDREVMVDYLKHCQKFLDKEIAGVKDHLQDVKTKLKALKGDDYCDSDLPAPKKNDGDFLWEEINKALAYNPDYKGSEFYTVQNPNPYLYLIQPTVHTCAALIKVNENFSCSIFDKIRDGEHIYLLGKNSFYRFIKFNGVIRGLFWNKKTEAAFEIGFHLKKDQYFYPSLGKQEFNDLVRLMTFIELGDIEVVELPAGRNNGKPKNNGKIANQSNYNVYVVDSSWNQIIIRTDGFAVRGHFRLQPCGANLADRKLIWIDAFEKHGYKRQPKAKIIHD